MWNEEVVRYTLNKYKDKLIYLKDVSIYGIDDWEKSFLNNLVYHSIQMLIGKWKLKTEKQMDYCFCFTLS